MIKQEMSFPDVLADVPTETLLEVFAAGPGRVRAAVEGLTVEELAARPRGPERWCARAIVLHLADAEIVGSARIRLVLASPGAALPMYDQDGWADGLAYGTAGQSEVSDALDLFAALRRATARVWPGAGDPAWERAGTHAEFGGVTLRQLLELYADHSERHVEQLLDTRTRLGHEMTLPAILPQRLY